MNLESVIGNLKGLLNSQNIEMFISQVKEKISPTLQMVAENLDNLSTVKKKLEQDIKSKIRETFPNGEEILHSIDEEGFTTLISYFWNLEEESIEILTLEHVITWIKAHFNSKDHSAACLYIFKTGFLTAKEYHVCFLDKEERPMLDGSEKHLIVHAKKCDAALLEQIGNKNMVVFK